MAVDIATFRIRYPEFDSPVLEDPALQIALDDAVIDFSRSKLSNDAGGQNIYDRIVFLLAAHEARLGELRAEGNKMGGAAIGSKSVGKVSVGYSRASSTSASEDYFLQTIYGQGYLQLLRRYCPTVLTIC